MKEQAYNPYENMLHVLDEAAEKLGLQRSEYETLRYPERELTVSIPVTMERSGFSKATVSSTTAREVPIKAGSAIIRILI